MVAGVGLGCSADDSADDSDQSPPVMVPGVEFVGEQVTAGEAESGTVSGSDQRGPGDVVVVTRAELMAPGFLVAYRSSSGAPGPLLGASALLEDGAVEAVEIPLDEPLTGSTEVFVMAHVDADANGRFEFPGADVPVEFEGGVVAVEVTVEADG